MDDSDDITLNKAIKLYLIKLKKSSQSRCSTMGMLKPSFKRSSNQLQPTHKERFMISIIKQTTDFAVEIWYL